MTTFNPMEIAKTKIMRRVTAAPCHFSVVVEVVRISDVSRLVSGYDAFGALLKDGALKIDKDGVLKIDKDGREGPTR